MNERFSELRVLRWHDQITRIVRDKERLGPIRANLDLTNLCNHNCPWCEPAQYRAETIKGSTREHCMHTIDTDKALEVLQDLGDLGCKTINFSGGGEPLVHIDFGILLRFAVRQGMRSWIVTNGSFLDKWMEDLQYAHHVRVSLDASNDTQHQEMHGSRPGEFDHVCENVRKLRHHCGIAKPELGIAYVCADCNSDTRSLESVLDFCMDVGVDFIHFRPLSEPEPKRLTRAWYSIAEKIEELAPGYPDVEVFPLGKRGNDVYFQREFKSCYAALTTAVIGANGDVVACCDERSKIFGNVYEQSFRSIWLSARHRSKAAEIVPQLCSRCLMCGYNRSVQNNIIENRALPELI